MSVSPGQHHVTQLLELVLAGEPDGVLAAPHVLESAGDVRVAAGHAREQGHIDAERRGPIGIEGDAYLAVAAAVDVGVRDPGYALDARLDDLLDEILVTGDVPLVARQGLDREPGDRIAEASAARVHDRLIDVDRVARYPVQAIHDLDQGALELRVDVEAQGNGTAATRSGGFHQLQAGQAAQRVLLGLDDFRFHLLGRGGAPAGGDLDNRALDVRYHLHRHAQQGDGAEQQHQQDGHDDGDGVAECGLGQGHGFVSVVLGGDIVPSSRPLD